MIFLVSSHFHGPQCLIFDFRISDPHGWKTNQIFTWEYRATTTVISHSRNRLVARITHFNVSVSGTMAPCVVQTRAKVIWRLSNFCVRTLHLQTFGRCFPCVCFGCYMKMWVRMETRCNCEHWAKTPSLLLLHCQLTAPQSRLTSSAGGHTSNTPLMADKVVGPGPAGQQMGTFGCSERQRASQVHCWRAGASYFHWMLRGNRFLVYGKAIKRQNLDSSKTENAKVRLMWGTRNRRGKMDWQAGAVP